ncbi:hypothetical protein B0H10DRAFT_2438387 [Mycena sp. CBHHK59/15]|nr:hypothetical protein B0H10DRAFT_2438387 [Mycena sp. CBHHK59/15]
MPRGLIIQRDIVENFPSSKQRRRRHIPFVQLRADVKSGADNLIPDDEDEPANGNLPDDGDAGEDDLPEPEIAEVIQRPVIQLHFGTEELYELDKIFTEASINAVSMWGGSLLTYQVDGMSDLNNIMADFEEDGPGNCGPYEIIIDDDYCYLRNLGRGSIFFKK